MTSDLQALYRDVIVDHNRQPRNFRTLAAGRRAEGFNPLCGDRLTVYVRLQGGIIAEAAFQGFGCAIATGSGEQVLVCRYATPGNWRGERPF